MLLGSPIDISDSRSRGVSANSHVRYVHPNRLASNRQVTENPVSRELMNCGLERISVLGAKVQNCKEKYE